MCRLLYIGVEPLKPHTAAGEPIVNDPAIYTSVAIYPDGRSENGMWSIFGQARDILAGGPQISYNGSNNSNSYVNILMSLIGMKAADYASVPTATISFPGINSDVAQRDLGIKWNIIGSTDNDVLVGGKLSDTFQGDAGMDILRGGSGDDRLHASISGNPIDYSADYLYGGTGGDTFYVGNDISSPRVLNSSWQFNTAIRETYDIVMDYSSVDGLFITFDAPGSSLVD